MTRAVRREEVRDSKRSGADEFTERERVLLAVWDESNTTASGDAFKQRLFSASGELEPLSPAETEARDSATMSQMAVAAEAECRRDDARRAGRERASTRGEVTDFHEIASLDMTYLHAAAARLCGDRERAKDLVQETLARGLLRFGQFKQGTNVRAWLATIMTRQFLDQIKHHKVVARAGRELMRFEGVESEIDLASPSISDTALWDAVQSLEPDLRADVDLRYVQQLSYKEIGQKLQLRVGTVGTRLMRAHERLRELLEGRPRG